MNRRNGGFFVLRTLNNGTFLCTLLSEFLHVISLLKKENEPQWLYKKKPRTMTVNDRFSWGCQIFLWFSCDIFRSDALCFHRRGRGGVFLLPFFLSTSAWNRREEQTQFLFRLSSLQSRFCPRRRGPFHPATRFLSFGENELSILY